MSEGTLKRAKSLVAEMTVEEKISQMLYDSPAIERLGIPAYNWWNEALHGVARAGVATVFPQAIGLAATFDPELLEEIGDVVSTEGRGKFNEFSKHGDRDIYKGLTFWSPNINIFRDPRWGRGQETYGEDPYLTGELGKAYVRGLQGPDRDHLKAAACAKHFAVHSGPEPIRHHFDARVNAHDLFDTYLYAFKELVTKADVEAVMGAYNRVNGEAACGSKTLLTDILRDKWGFKGHVVSDCWAIKDINENHHITDTIEESAALAVNSGCDLNCGEAFNHLYDAYRQGLVKEEALDRAVTRLLDVRIRLGMLMDYPSPYENISYDVVECEKHTELSVDAARRGMVLLENKDDFLPLDKNKINTVAVIGPNANRRSTLEGNYCGTLSEYITPLEGIQRYLGREKRVIYAEGCHLFKDKVEGLARNEDRIGEAVIAAEMADVVVLCLGLDATLEGEEGDAGNEYAGGDKPSLLLPGLQNKLFEEVVKVGKPVVTVLLAGSAIDLSKMKNGSKALINAWYPGARGGRAIAEVLFGEYSPSGHLPVTFYKDSDKLPEFTDYSMKGRTYRYTDDNILYPFGYGLSYSKLSYSDLKVTKKGGEEPRFLVSVTVKNEGRYDVHEPVMVFVSHMDRKEYEPLRALKGLKNVFLLAGEEKNVTIELTHEAFEIIFENGEGGIVPGKYKISVGIDSENEAFVEI